MVYVGQHQRGPVGASPPKVDEPLEFDSTSVELEVVEITGM